MDNKTTEYLIQQLNQALGQEYACAIRYLTHAATISGPYHEDVAARLKEIADDELMHAGKLRERILALGGIPTMQVSQKDLIPAERLEDILRVNIEEEKHAADLYIDILRHIPDTHILLRRVIEDIAQEEQVHLEELEAFIAPC